MKKKYALSLLICLLLTFVISNPVFAQLKTGAIEGTLSDSVSGEKLVGAAVQLSNQKGTSTNALGYFKINGVEPGTYQLKVQYLGYKPIEKTVEVRKNQTTQINLPLASGNFSLKEVTITQSVSPEENISIINRLDTRLRPVNSAQDMLTLVPGLVIAQHAGGGKAEQIFVRGFDADHGTDFYISMDGMPVNMVSHAHGQGYADFHFAIPEILDNLQVYKGPYHAQFGNFATAGAAAFTTKNYLEESMVKLEYGRFDTYRGVAAIDLLQGRKLFGKANESAYIAGEYMYNNAYFDSPQNYKRLNLFGKYTADITPRSSLSLSGSTFSSNWDASGQIPERAVESGRISRFGSIDDTEGGNTGRTNANIQLTTALPQNAVLKNQVYYSYYDFDLYSNFTFFLRDSINGDGIRQKETGRHIFGYNGSFQRDYNLAGLRFRTTLGLGTRLDQAGLTLSNATQRAETSPVVAGKVLEDNTFLYANTSVDLTNKLTLNAGLRADYFYFKYNNYLESNTDMTGNESKSRISPKLNVTYQLNPAVQLYARSGLGFHSNDTRAVVSNRAANVLPKAFGYETGTLFKISDNLLVNAAAWSLHIENELVYVGDEGVVEINGPTQRYGADLSVRYQLSRLLYADADFNYSHGRFTDLPEGENYIPLAPSFTSMGGLTLKQEKGFNASLRYRHINSRPANEDNSVQAKGYVLFDAVAAYRLPKVQFSVTAENLLNTEWNQAQFDTESQLRNETMPVSELHYTPGTPFNIRGSISYYF